MPGVRVRVPLRNKTVTGVLVAVSDATDIDPAVLRNLTEVVDDKPLLPPHLFYLADFISTYYRCPLGDTLAAVLPAGLLRADGEIASADRSGRRGRPRDPHRTSEAPSSPSSRRPPNSECRPSLPAQEFRAEALWTRWWPSGWFRWAANAGIARRRPRWLQSSCPTCPLDDLLEQCARAPRRREVSGMAFRTGPPGAGGRGLRRGRMFPGDDPGDGHGGSPHPLLSGAGAAATLGPAARGRTPRPHRRAADTWSMPSRPPSTRDRYSPFLLEGHHRFRQDRGLPPLSRTGPRQGPQRDRPGARDRPHTGRFRGRRTPVRLAGRGAPLRPFRGRTVAGVAAHPDGGVKVVVGPRSALFAPLDDLGFIAVDEEHDAAYKQQEAPRYQARDLALVAGQHLKVPVLLCSATPSVEAASLVERDLADHLRLTRRVAGGSLPEVELVDLRGEPPEPGEQGRTLFSRRLRELLEETLGRGEQAILLMQRRGWAPILLCRDCGHKIQCPDCSVSLVVHQRSGDLRCHYCGHRQQPLASVPFLQGRSAGCGRRRHRKGRGAPEPSDAGRLQRHPRPRHRSPSIGSAGHPRRLCRRDRPGPHRHPDGGQGTPLSRTSP